MSPTYNGELRGDVADELRHLSGARSAAAVQGIVAVLPVAAPASCADLLSS
jgi:hypothetical protein